MPAKKTLTGMIGALTLSCIMSCNHISNANPLETTQAVKPKSTVALTGIDHLANWQPLAYDSTKKYIYLTFDDGPQHGTVDSYNRCKELGVKASFFMVGMHMEGKSDGKKIVEMIRDSYPEFLLANHSYSHAAKGYHTFYKQVTATEAEFEKAQTLLRVPYKIVRLPGNSAWVRAGEIKASKLVRPVTQLLDSAGYNVFGWEVEWRFNHKNARPVQTPEQLAAEVDSAFARNRTHVKNHVVILTHDRMFQRQNDADSLAKFISILKKNPAYVFETVDHYPGLKRPVYQSY